MRDIAKLIAAFYILCICLGFLGLIYDRGQSIHRHYAQERKEIERTMVKAIRGKTQTEPR